ncbi:hypothetical protein [Paenibacillus daejeonensis]|uniref:hypothetical protein n=1 Tax=Paenibacillus daejeonensis TaxID=135193 RepID=UPI000361A025|nr:hypothetical protein [Paenibacillus daejeonensis]
MSKPYFTDRVFSLNQNIYKFAAEEDQVVTYHSSTDAPIQVSTDDEQHRTVTIDGQSYVIADKSVPYMPQFQVTYPNGNIYSVEDQNGMLLSYDDEGNFFMFVQVYANGERITEEGDEDVQPSALVTAAYPEYHDKRGMPGFLFLALGLMILGWCNFRYRAFQDVLFHLSPQRLNYENPEPSDFYYIGCKISGIAIMIGSIVVAFQAY